ncbi:hypothetical protein SLW70_11675 [Flavobacterium sp. NG2]|uniref:hypothetical protein n=1 Tax=Flavobacterium sp. NG2 TaxID=3097547 RepID=UPI002A80C23D|nr:hypothetical protein [Flavobacterium sp. NG2]WPR70591.1 hypothetical protein SLW70_11675 [Flavobacterium sp. NG2]
MKSTIYKKIESIIQLPFMNETFHSGAVCFADSEELRDDFKLYFTNYDLINYIYGVVVQVYPNQNLKSVTDFKIPFPANVTAFWETVEVGKKHRQKNPISVIELADCSDFNWVDS